MLRLGAVRLALSSGSTKYKKSTANYYATYSRATASLVASPLFPRATLVAAAAVSTSAACAFCSSSAVDSVVKPNLRNNGLPTVILYQYEPCPYCCKVKAVLDYFKIPYEVVEVNPLTKNEIKAFTDYRKVPVVRINDKVIVDSSTIILRLQNLVNKSKNTEQSLTTRQEEDHWRQWVDQKLIVLTPPNIYRTIPEALQAFDYCLSEGNFTPMERRLSKYVGAFIMYCIAKRSKQKYDITDERQALYSALNTWLEAIGDERDFLGGHEPNLADLSVFGVLRAMHGLDTYADILRDTNIEPWVTRMITKVGATARTN
ncbi:hypothetical protein CCR75_004361 [Bremia lactucae]|uniref:Prostaglandin E synthase 2 n=1 Tax=Bremia lactucae TaxID=4779 RepID=A0A976FJS3_BRELC|nr:hypothetical protein CCR75_004361 [Bremia lactucae]